MKKEQKQLMEYITQISFAMDDVVLFLDSHPCDTDALAYYEELRKERQSAVDSYTCQYGAIQKYDVNTEGDVWSWNMGPWPWQIERRGN